MDQIGSEIGQKMRCAVKAKLNEMEAGTYIDEELPDYVMILLVNKKSRESMEEALNLFLGEHTAPFVNWLHEVLEKLEKVSVPQRKRKSSENEEKQKKEKKKQKNDEELPALPSITEVIKEGFIQRSKKDLEIAVEVKKKEDDFDIPTITDIAKEAKEKKQAEELTQLKEIQEKIYKAKKQLKTMVSDESDESDEGANTPPPPSIGRAKIHVNPQFLRNSDKITPKDPKPKEIEPESKVIKISSIRRAEREIYVPKHRRGMPERVERDVRDRRSRSRSRPRPRVDLRQDLSRRIHSRVTVVPAKPDEEEEILRTSVSSVIRIKPRTMPKVQASKVLLLRAVADAQRSTTQIPLSRPKSPKRPPREDLRQKILIHVPEVDALDDYDDVENDIEDDVNEEYIPEPITRTSESESEVYVPRKSAKIDDEYDPIKTQEKTQFVVTLTGAKSRLGQRKTAVPEKEHQRRPVKERIGYRFNFHEDEETKKRRKERFDRGYERIEKHRTPTPPPPPKISGESPDHSNDDSNSHDSRPPSSVSNLQHPKLKEVKNIEGTRSLTPPVRRDLVRARTISPINFDLTDEETQSHDDDSDFESRVNKESATVEKKSTIKKLESTKKFDNVPPLLSAVTIADKPKERCRFFPNCRDTENCEYHHPNTPCTAFPACRFGDSCLYLHPQCRFDEMCKKPDCPYTHTVPIIISAKGTAPLLASSVVPVQNYKSLNVTPLPPLCRFGPSCTRNDCVFYHPKPCKFGSHCKNRIECNFYHGNLDLPSKDKLTWKPH